MKSKYFFYIFFISFLFNRCCAFIVNDYHGALESYGNLDKLIINSLDKLKEHISIIEFVNSDGTKQFVNGYVDGYSFFILSNFLPTNNSLNPIKQIQYFYDHKLREIKIYQSLEKKISKDLIGGSAEIVETGNYINFASFSNLFMGKNSIKHFIFKNHLLISRHLSDINKYFSEHHLGLWSNYYQDILSPVLKKMDLYSNNFSKNLWFIIGKPDGIIVDELVPIPLNYINPNIFLLSVKVEQISRQRILMVVDGTNFKQHDLGSYLVRCLFPKYVENGCNFFGQITKVETIDQIKQVVVVDIIPNWKVNRLKPNFINQTVATPNLMASNIKGYGDALPVEDGSTSGVATSIKTDESILKSGRVNKSQELLGDQEHLTSKKQRLNPQFEDSSSISKFMEEKHDLFNSTETHMPLWKVSCKEINRIGTYYLENDVIIIVEKIEEEPMIAEISDRYHIKGVYITKLGKFMFNLCHNYGDIGYVTHDLTVIFDK